MPPLELRSSAKLALVISAAFPLSAGAAPAGRIDFAIGNVTAKSAEGITRPLAKGAEVNTGETIDTGSGRAQLRYTDGTQVSLTPSTQFRIDDYRFNGKNDGEEKAFFSLLKGGFRTITGLIGKNNRDAYKLSTSTATIGIRGTEFLVVASDNGVTISAGEGLVQVCNAGGCIILAGGEAATVTDKDGKPVRVINKGADATSEKPGASSVVVEKPKDEGLVASLASGPGYAMAMVGQRTYDGGEGTTTDNFRKSHATGTATFASGSALSNYVVDGGEGGSYVSSSIASGVTDGAIGWGRWSAGSDTNGIAGSTSSGNNALTDVHYIVGMPTSSSDMSALGTKTGTYSLIGGSVPISSGSLTAKFSAGEVDFSLAGVSVNSASYSINGTGIGISGSLFGTSNGGSASATGGGCGGGCSTDVSGIFVGANAIRTGLVFEFTDGGKARGAAAFTQTGLTTVSPP